MPTPILERRGDKYYAFWSEGRRSKRKSMGTTDRAVAEQRFAQWLLVGGHKSQVEPGVKAGMTVAELWSIYDAKHVQTVTAAPASIGYAWKNLEPHFGKMQPSEIEQDTIDDYEEKRLAGKIGRVAVSGTVRKELAALRAMLNWHAAPARGKKRLLDKADVPAFDLPADSDPRDRWLTTEEIEAIHKAAEGSTARVQIFLWLALETAARKQAIYDLTWDRVDFETGMIHFNVPGRVQTKKRRVSVPMSNRLKLQLTNTRFLDPRRKTVLPPGGEVWAQMQSVVRRAGLAPAVTRKTGAAATATGVSPHTLRHTAATHMARRGVPLYDIAGVLGNTLAMVEKVYAHHCPGRLRNAVNMISGEGVTT